jgi:hypothetical protein
MADSGKAEREHGEGNSHSSRTGHGSRIAGWADTDGEESAQGAEQHFLDELVSRHPITALAAVFGVGVGLGVLAVAIFGRQEERNPWTSRIPTSSLRELSSGLRRLPEKVAEYVPEALSWR